LRTRDSQEEGQVETNTKFAKVGSGNIIQVLFPESEFIDVMDLFSIASYQSDSAKILLARQDFGFWQLLVQQFQSVSAFQLHWPFV